MKHTPGPWEVKGNSKMVGVYTVRAHNGKPWGSQDKANAKLISAAPDLLAALEAITDHAITYFDLGECGGKELNIRRMAKEAIKKAKGL